MSFYILVLMLLYFCFIVLLNLHVMFCNIMFHIFPHLLALSMCSMYSVLFNCSFVLYNALILFFILNIRTCCSVRFAASETLAVFILICEYFGVMLCVKHSLLNLYL
jgi:hypothetical protein